MTFTAADFGMSEEQYRAMLARHARIVAEDELRAAVTENDWRWSLVNEHVRRGIVTPRCYARGRESARKVRRLRRELGRL